MTSYVLKKICWHTAVALTVWFIIDRFSPEGRLYAGWFIGLMGACYLLVGWLNFMKSRGTDLIGRLSRAKEPEVPYYLRGPEKASKPRFSVLYGKRFRYDDDLQENYESQTEDIDGIKLLQCRALAFGICGILFLILSGVLG